MIDGDRLSRIGVVGIAQADTNDQCIHQMVEEVNAALTAKGVRTLVFEHPREAECWAALAKAGVSTVLCYGIAMSQAFHFRAHLRGMNVMLACLDHPIYWIDLYRRFAQLHHGRLVISYNTSTNLGCAQNLMGEHDVRVLRHSASPRAVIPAHQREAAVVFSGNFTPAAQFRAGLVKHDPALLPLFDDAVARLKSREAATLEEAVAPCFTDIHGAQRDTFVTLARMVDGYVRSDMRERIVRSLRDVPVHLFGIGWDCLDLPGNVRLYGSREVAEVHRANGAARIVVNSMPPYYESHERMFEAAAAGSALVTARTPYAEATFGRCAALFDAPDEVGALCDALLRDPERLEDMGRHGIGLIRDREGWAHRADEIIAMLDPGHEAEAMIDTGPLPLAPRIDCDLALDLRDLASLDLSPPRLAAAAAIRLHVAPDGLERAVQFLAQAGHVLSPGAGVVVLVETLVSPGGFAALGDALDRLGYVTAGTDLRVGQSSLTVIKGDAAGETDRQAVVHARGRRLTLTFPSARDPQRLDAVHYKALAHPYVLAAIAELSARPGVVVDLGAGAGARALFAAGTMGRPVVAVETDPAALACLRANVAAAGLDGLVEVRDDASAIADDIAMVLWSGGAVDADLLRAGRPPIVVAAPGLAAAAAARLAPFGYAPDTRTPLVFLSA